MGWADPEQCPEEGPRGGYEFLTTIGRNDDNLGNFVYKSGSNDVIGWVLEEATGRPLVELMAAYLWQPMGAEFDAYLTVDGSGFVSRGWGMSATLRDLGRLGLLVLRNGKAPGQKVVPSTSIGDIREKPAYQKWPAWHTNTEGRMPYYRSFWWGWGHEEGDIRALGKPGQYLHVAPEAGLVIAVFSSWPTGYGDAATYGMEARDDFAAALLETFR